ncbi:MAG: single-stranded-DNA-specific exonuclease RecJ [Desulfobacterales bacterium]|jgi:single-stranded-DNA-specific exonuclease|nr:single-stranded-DNA-specific exonuclease RecJ [Desulfobacterales bacterium]
MRVVPHPGIGYDRTMEKHWTLLSPEPRTVRRIAAAFNIDPILAAILANRGLESDQAIHRFLNPCLDQLRAPQCLAGMSAAVERIGKAICEKQRILVFGDYDVDGVTATVMLLEFLTHAGADATYYIPHRVREGYGLQPLHVTDYARNRNIGLIITVDCGSGSHAAVRAARECGIGVVITDHHSVAPPYPEADAFVNPKRQDCEAGLDHLSGVGVAFYLAAALRQRLREEGRWRGRTEPNLKSACDLVALGTVADVVPLKGENRVLTRAGMEMINQGRRLGLRALVESCSRDAGMLDADDVAFKLAPRLNAAGRMAHARQAVALLCAAEAGEARQLAELLGNLNTDRQKIEGQVFDEILVRLEKNPAALTRRTLIIHGNEWPEGVLGIVASRLVRQFCKPAVVLSVRDGLAKGSARSLPGIDLAEGFAACRDHLETFGGHALAAGLSLKTGNIDRFAQALETVVTATTDCDALLPQVQVDCELPLNAVSAALIDSLETLKPFGAGNPEPLFMARDVAVKSSQIVGRRHRRMVLLQTGRDAGTPLSAIQFNIDPQHPQPDFFPRMAFRLRWNRWNGSRTPQVFIEET